MNLDSKHSKDLTVGALIFREGEPGDCAYIINKGRIELTILMAGKEVPFALLEKGELFGEMALIDDNVRTATATAIEDTELLIISRDFIEQKIELSDPTIRLLLDVILERYRDVYSRLGDVVEGLEEHEKSKIDLVLNKISSNHREISDTDNSISALQQKNSTKKSERALSDIALTRMDVIKESTLKHALANNEFEMYYQPIVEIPGGEIKGCEALIRWNSPELGLTSPADFIDLAEQIGFIVPLGRWITNEACNALCEFRKHKDIYMSINLSTKQFESKTFIHDIEEAVRKAGIKNGCIKFEITESILMSNPELAGRALKRLTETGFSIAIDDFGTGYSSFSYLHRFPIDTLKIDRSFISAMFSNKKSMEIVRTIVLLAQNLNMTTIAEGIENTEEMQQLSGFGCEFGQGYHFSRPTPYAEFLKLLDNK